MMFPPGTGGPMGMGGQAMPPPMPQGPQQLTDEQIEELLALMELGGMPDQMGMANEQMARAQALMQPLDKAQSPMGGLVRGVNSAMRGFMGGKQQRAADAEKQALIAKQLELRKKYGRGVLSGPMGADLLGAMPMP